MGLLLLELLSVEGLAVLECESGWGGSWTVGLVDWCWVGWRGHHDGEEENASSELSEAAER